VPCAGFTVDPELPLHRLNATLATATLLMAGSTLSLVYQLDANPLEPASPSAQCQLAVEYEIAQAYEAGFLRKTRSSSASSTSATMMPTLLGANGTAPTSVHTVRLSSTWPVSVPRANYHVTVEASYPHHGVSGTPVPMVITVVSHTTTPLPANLAGASELALELVVEERDWLLIGKQRTSVPIRVLQVREATLVNSESNLGAHSVGCVAEYRRAESADAVPAGGAGYGLARSARSARVRHRQRARVEAHQHAAHPHVSRADVAAVRRARSAMSGSSIRCIVFVVLSTID